jgi:hypothetical protein
LVFNNIGICTPPINTSFPLVPISLLFSTSSSFSFFFFFSVFFIFFLLIFIKYGKILSIGQKYRILRRLNSDFVIPPDNSKIKGKTPYGDGFILLWVCLKYWRYFCTLCSSVCCAKGMQNYLWLLCVDSFFMQGYYINFFFNFVFYSSFIWCFS